MMSKMIFNKDNQSSFEMGCSKVEELYRKQLTYLERPIISNKPYNYETLRVGSPYDFYLQLVDPTNAAYGAKLEVLLSEHLKELRGGKVGGGEGDKDILPPKLPSDLFYEGMPVLVKMKDKAGVKIEELQRGEVIKIRDGERQEVDVLLVDQGLVLGDLRWECDLLPVTREILRVPKLGISCTIAMISPEGGAEWPKEKDWEKDFLGQMQIVIFLDFYPESKSYEVAVEVDKVNLGLKYFHTAVAQPLVLPDFEDENQIAGRFPVADYAAWVGLKIIAYGLKVYRDEKDGDKIKCAVQIQPDIVNDVQTKIEQYLQTASDDVKRAPFDKSVGSFCLAKFGAEYFRSTILKKVEGKYLVQYVDYKEEQLVEEHEMIKLPESLETIQEGAVICQITDLMCSDYNNLDKLKELLENQDLYAVVDACDVTIFGSELLVSFYQPTPEFDGRDTPLADILELPEGNRPPLVREILQTMELIPESWESVFLQQPILIPNQVYKFKVVAIKESSEDPWNPVAVLVNEKDDDTKDGELTWFYENGGCDPGTKEMFMETCDAAGMYVAAKPVPEGQQLEDELEEGEIIEGEAGWLRAKILRDTSGENGKMEVLYVDYGFTAWVDKKEVFPLHKYFCKEPVRLVRLAVAYERLNKFM